MDTGKFHDRLTAIVKDAFSRWDHASNPLEWPALPSAVADLTVDVLKEGMAASRGGCFGAPFHIGYGAFKDRNHHPYADAVIKCEIVIFDDAEDYASGSFNLADAVLKDAEGGDNGWTVGHAIHQLEATIERLKREAASRGWDIGYKASEPPTLQEPTP